MIRTTLLLGAVLFPLVAGLGAAPALAQEGTVAAPGPEGAAAAPAPDTQAIRDTIRGAIGGAMAAPPHDHAEPAGQEHAAAPEPPANAGVLLEQANDPAYLVGKELRCPVCQGMPIADSPADMAQDMMRRVRALHAEGKSKDEILDYFVKSYGEWVLLRPRPRGENWLVWILPPLALLFGVVAIRATIRRGPTPAKAAPPVAEGDAEDPYIRLVRDEVQR